MKISNQIIILFMTILINNCSNKTTKILSKGDILRQEDERVWQLRINSIGPRAQESQANIGGSTLGQGDVDEGTPGINSTGLSGPESEVNSSWDTLREEADKAWKRRIESTALRVEEHIKNSGWDTPFRDRDFLEKVVAIVSKGEIMDAYEMKGEIKVEACYTPGHNPEIIRVTFNTWSNREHFQYREFSSADLYRFVNAWGKPEVWNRMVA